MTPELSVLARLAEEAADRARAEILPRFRRVAVERKADGTPVTEADRAAERAIRAVLQQGDPAARILGEELGGVEEPARGRVWVVDPIDGTLAFSRGIPLFATLVACLVDGEPRVGLIDLPSLDERYVGWKGGGCRRNGAPVHVSSETDLGRALVAHGDPECFDRAGERAAFERMAHDLSRLRGYTDAFGHALVLCGAVDAMVDLDLRVWDVAATRVLVPEAGGRCELIDYPNERFGLVIGAAALVETLRGFLGRGG